MNGYRNASYAGFVLYLVGLAAIGYGVYNLTEEQKLDKAGLKATGTVIDLDKIEPYRRAWVKFQTNKGKSVKFLDKLYWNHAFEKYKVGQVVEVIYDPADAIRTATINEFFQRNTAPWWPVIVGGVVILVGWIMRRILLRKARQFDERYGR